MFDRLNATLGIVYVKSNGDDTVYYNVVFPEPGVPYTKYVATFIDTVG